MFYPPNRRNRRNEKNVQVLAVDQPMRWCEGLIPSRHIQAMIDLTLSKQGGSRMPVQLRVYSPSMDSDDDEMQDPTIRIRLADLLPLLAFAKKNNYLWLQDFLDDEVSVTADLYDVLRSFSDARQTSA
jgi:hypothetical protein